MFKKLLAAIIVNIILVQVSFGNQSEHKVFYIVHAIDFDLKRSTTITDLINNINIQSNLKKQLYSEIKKQGLLAVKLPIVKLDARENKLNIKIDNSFDAIFNFKNNAIVFKSNSFQITDNSKISDIIKVLSLSPSVGKNIFWSEAHAVAVAEIMAIILAVAISVVAYAASCSSSYRDDNVCINSKESILIQKGKVTNLVCEKQKIKTISFADNKTINFKYANDVLPANLEFVEEKKSCLFFKNENKKFEILPGQPKELCEKILAEANNADPISRGTQLGMRKADFYSLIERHIPYTVATMCCKDKQKCVEEVNRKAAEVSAKRTLPMLEVKRER